MGLGMEISVPEKNLFNMTIAAPSQKTALTSKWIYGGDRLIAECVIGRVREAVGMDGTRLSSKMRKKPPYSKHASLGCLSCDEVISQDCWAEGYDMHIKLTLGTT